MTEAHRRKKQPEQVRQQLLEVAARLSHEQGVAGITLDAVSQAAGVSKGGLLHHFPNKLALLDGLFDDLVTRFDREIEAAMAHDPVAKGRFTRAYIDVCFALDPATDVPGWRMLTIALIAEPHLKSRWRDWVRRRSTEFAETDASTGCVLARFACDGVWLADLMQSHDLDAAARVGLVENLKALSAQ
ncbi:MULTISPECIES: TetR/AcrR family transcriptional regulator [Sinorhizobium/Ensifer group]|uniref:TetR/AcrR family transcriptional regulator n=1 Tax=Sinorhizobium/Ensifer group TaxID=227292 RepID=UPI00071D5329|nr:MULTISPECIES: TetR/AcrR family transcriptional regulator [Sinorhizobium/Ensifer group]KSV95025.1 TetR family transcriptional regulator [Sinorhizobium sp. GL28]MBV7519579.1 TetR/AcrR family transcriptional regulator [Ensifer sp. ENS12]